nr:MAG TPA: hypothetical protein [Caudoviricetes sp.]
MTCSIILTINKILIRFFCSSYRVYQFTISSIIFVI